MIQEATPVPANVLSFLHFESPYPGRTIYITHQRRASPWLSWLSRGHGYMAVEGPTGSLPIDDCRFGYARLRKDSVLIRWDGNLAWTCYPIKQFFMSF